MANIEITKTELVWPGKYNEDGTRKEVERVHLPFQVIETVNETRATRERKKAKAGTFFEVWDAKEGDTFEEGWKNKLIWGDNLLVMGSLLEKFAGKIDLIYIDPPFATGADFSFTAEIGDSDIEVTKEQSIIEEKAYRDTWGRGLESYLEMMSARLSLMRDLLREGGSLIVHIDTRVNSHLRLVLDELFGKDSLINEVAWCYGGGGAPRNYYPQKHDTLLWYTKNENWTFNRQFRPYTEGTLERGLTQVKGDKYKLREEGAGLDDWWAGKEVQKILSPTAYENLKFPTQKPEGLLSRVVTGHSNQSDLVADIFCGSGTTLAVAEKLGRRWIGCDLSRWAIHVTRKRLLGIENCKPFEVLNLGKYERKYWQGVTFGDKKKSDQQLSIYQYLAFILKLYGAEPISGMQHLHGKKGKAVVHVGAVDAPVTIDEINACLDECVAIQQKELHVLGWEWEMGLYDLMTDAAKGRGIKLVLLNIPREVMEQQAVDKGDIKFFELAYLEVDIKQEKGRKILLSLKDFVIPNTELIPEEIRSKIKKWSDYIDYWAIDWDFQNDTFMNGWVTYRTRKDRTLALKSDAHSYEKPGKYTVMVKVVDIFGNDTSQAFEVEVK